MHTLSKVVAYGLLVLADVVEKVFRLFRREDAEVSGADAKVWTYPNTRHAHENAVGLASLALENLSELLLKQSRYLVLSCFLDVLLFTVWFYKSICVALILSWRKMEADAMNLDAFSVEKYFTSPPFVSRVSISGCLLR